MPPVIKPEAISSIQSLTERVRQLSEFVRERLGRAPGGWRRARPRRIGEVGPPRPARSAKRCESGERVTQPIRQGRTGDRPRPPRRAIAHDAAVSPPATTSKKAWNDELGGSAIRRPHNLEVPANPLAHSAGELNLRPLETERGPMIV
jgi:hypothetical protein